VSLMILNASTVVYLYKGVETGPVILGTRSSCENIEFMGTGTSCRMLSWGFAEWE
jgi:hypothetical protein